jgi:hypothetical protein
VDAWTDELRAQCELYLARTRRVSIVAGAVFAALAIAFGVVALRDDPGAAFKGGAVGAVLIAAATAAGHRWPTSPRGSLVLTVVAGPVVFAALLLIGPLLDYATLLGFAAATEAGVAACVAVSPWYLRRNPRLFARIIELGWDPAHPYRSMLRPTKRG